LVLAAAEIENRLESYVPRLQCEQAYDGITSFFVIANQILHQTVEIARGSGALRVNLSAQTFDCASQQSLFPPKPPHNGLNRHTRVFGDGIKGDLIKPLLHEPGKERVDDAPAGRLSRVCSCRLAI
jgi:hypothetical protein